MIILLWISRLTTSVYTTRGIYALVLDLQREDKVWPRFPSVAGSSWFFPSGQLGSRQSGLYSNVLVVRIVSWYYPTFFGRKLVTKYLFRLIPQSLQHGCRMAISITWCPGLAPGMLFCCDISHTWECHLCNSKLLVLFTSVLTAFETPHFLLRVTPSHSVVPSGHVTIPAWSQGIAPSVEC